MENINNPPFTEHTFSWNRKLFPSQTVAPHIFANVPTSIISVMDYIKGGEVLIAPRLDYKYQYLLKCSECDECYCLLGPFISHCASHYDRETSAPLEDKYSVGEFISEPNDDASENNDVNEEAEEERFKLKEESVAETTNEDPLNTIDTDKEEDMVIKEEVTLNENNTSQHYMEFSTIDESLEKEPTEDEMDDTAWENDESENDDEGEVCFDEAAESDGNNTTAFLRSFMASKENVLALIEAYKHQPKLWNNNLPTQLRRPQDRINCLQQIAVELQEETNVQLGVKQVAAVIVHLRHKCRMKLELEKTNNNYEENKKELWFCGHLSFLKPFLENNPIAILDSHPQDLVPEQIVHILDIYKRFPPLWNTDTMENCCKGKRAEALSEMINAMELEMELEVDESTLKKYLHCVHVYFSREKRRALGPNNTKDLRSEYYEHMMYLYNHVGPFKCNQCKRQFKSPLQLKAHKHQHDESLGLKCPQCKKVFKSVDPYIAHVRRHMNDLGVECQECGKRFLRTADLMIHMRSHTGAKPFCCDVCGASFRHSQAFNVHKRRHVKQYSHNCPVCSKGCYTKNELNIHMRTHKDIRDFECEICGKAFKTKKTMQQHTFIHEEGRNHLCPLCGKAFKNKIGLGHHVKTHGRNKAIKSSDLISFFN